MKDEIPRRLTVSMRDIAIGMRMTVCRKGAQGWYDAKLSATGFSESVSPLQPIAELLISSRSFQEMGMSQANKLKPKLAACDIIANGTGNSASGARNLFYCNQRARAESRRQRKEALVARSKARTGMHYQKRRET